jgi:MerR family transcriptional regulator, redox-sensitive transcriptional activator SoxR
LARELSVGEVAARAGIAVSALHFYERKGLIRSYRTTGNQRRYEKDVLRRLAVIRLANELGIPLSDVAKRMQKLPQGRPPGKDDWQDLSSKWRDELDRRIVLLTRLRDELTGCIGCGCLSMEHCPLFNPDDRLGQDGAGPRRLLREGTDIAPVDQGPSPEPGKRAAR